MEGDKKELRDYLVSKRNRPHPHKKVTSSSNLKRRRDVSDVPPNVKELKQKDPADVSTTEESFTNAEYSVMSELDSESFEDFSDDEGKQRRFLSTAAPLIPPLLLLPLLCLLCRA